MQTSELIRDYLFWKSNGVKTKTLTGYETVLKYFSLHMMDCPVEDLDIDDITAYFVTARNMNFWSDNNFVQWRAGIKGFLEWAKASGYDVPDARFLPPSMKKIKMPRVANIEEIELIRKEIRNAPKEVHRIRDMAILNILVDTGMRRSEVVWLEFSWLDLSKDTSRVRNAKGRSREWGYVVWSENTTKSIQQWMEIRQKYDLYQSDRLFLRVDPIDPGKPMRPKAISNMLAKYSARAGIRMVNPHSIRHMKGRSLHRMNVPTLQISQILRHNDPKSTEIYTFEAKDEHIAMAKKYL